MNLSTKWIPAIQFYTGLYNPLFFRRSGIVNPKNSSLVFGGLLNLEYILVDICNTTVQCAAALHSITGFGPNVENN